MATLCPALSPEQFVIVLPTHILALVCLSPRRANSLALFKPKQQNTDRWQGWKTRRLPSLSLLAEIIHDNGIETDGGLVMTSKSQHLLSHGLRDQAGHGHTHRW